VSLAVWLLLTGLLALYVVEAGLFGTTYGQPITNAPVAREAAATTEGDAPSIDEGGAVAAA
jgi:hypothetical protein